jgi:predicted site-specific integrase-resolvase
MINDRVTLAEWAQRQGISYMTAWRWTKEDAIPVPWRKTPSGTILVDAPVDEKPANVALYARVSSHDQRNDLAACGKSSARGFAFSGYLANRPN